MNTQIITTPLGERLVLLPESEFLRLLEAAEDAQDVADARAIKAKLASGDEEAVPSEIANRILDGENRVKVWRQYRGLSARELAAAAEIGAPYLSEIEAGKKEASVLVMKRIASVLRLTLDDLV